MKPVTVVYLVAILVVQESAAQLFGKESKRNVLVAPINDFSQRLYQQVSCCGDSLIYSPYSIHSALTMASHGARGNTLTEMNSVLGLSNLGDETKNAYHDLILQLNNERSISLHTANGMFVNPKYEIEISFVDDVTQQYFAAVEKFDLQAIGGPEKIVNDFIAEKTENQIQDILPRDTINQDTLLILVNTIFLNASWAVPFSEYSTRRQVFNLLDGTQKQVGMMHQVESFYYKHDTARKADVLEMPFKGNRFGLYIVLPTDNDGISDLENSLASNGVDDLFDDLHYTHLNLSIPKFKIESTLDLIPTLKDMGMERPFSRGMADFSGFTTNGPVYIDKVIHQAVIDVGESGTVASAATVVSISLLSSIRELQSTNFVADHPFLFFLKNSQTGQILFQGKFSG